MKSILILLTILMIGSTSLRAQDATANANALAGKIANKMKDSLSLSTDQRNGIKAINLKLHEEKTAVRSRYINNRDSVGLYLQKVEYSRDTLYKTVLSPEQYQLYKQNKRVLVSAN